MKKLLSVLIAAVIITGIVFGSTLVASSAGENQGPTLTIVNPVNSTGKGEKVAILGGGFEPGQELRVMVVDSAYGVKSDVGYALTPAPVANDAGAFAAVWGGYGRYVSRGLLGAGVHALYVTDIEYNVLAHATFVVYDAKAPREEWPSVADFLVPE